MKVLTYPYVLAKIKLQSWNVHEQGTVKPSVTKLLWDILKKKGPGGGVGGWFAGSFPQVIVCCPQPQPPVFDVYRNGRHSQSKQPPANSMYNCVPVPHLCGFIEN